MLKFITTWWHESRVVRKFRRDKAAMISLAVIGAYAAVFVWTMITPLDVNYVNLQQRKISEYKEYKHTVKDLTVKSGQLKSEISRHLAGTKAKKAAKKVAKKPVARKAAARKAAVARPAPRRAPAARPAAPASRPAHTHSDLAPAGHTHKGLAAADHTHKGMAVVGHTHKELAGAVKLHAEIKSLRKAFALQQQLSAVEREKLVATLKLREAPPQQLGWLSRYNQDLGQAYAKPSWLGANEQEKTIIALVEPNIPFAALWVRQSILAHGRRGALGSDRLGRDIFKRVLVSINVAFKIGIVTALIACFIGLLLGGIAGFFGGWVDLMITYLYSVFSAVPYIVLVLLIAAIFRDSPGLLGLYVAFGATFWIGPARVVRGEVLKIKEMEYIQAAWALGNSRMRILIRHVLPNTMHLIFVYFSLIFIGAIKSEVILTFLGLGVKNMPSWGGMISDASKEIIGGFWWQMIGASVALFFLVYAFNIFTDALQDALDPKHTK